MIGYLLWKASQPCSQLMSDDCKQLLFQITHWTFVSSTIIGIVSLQLREAILYKDHLFYLENKFKGWDWHFFMLPTHSQELLYENNSVAKELSEFSSFMMLLEMPVRVIHQIHHETRLGIKHQRAKLNYLRIRLSSCGVKCCLSCSIQ